LRTNIFTESDRITNDDLVFFQNYWKKDNFINVLS